MIPACKVNNKDVTITNAALIRKYDLTERRPIMHDHDYSDAPNVVNFSEIKKASVSHFAG